MNNKTMITTIIFSFLAGTIGLGFNALNSSNEVLKQELNIFKVELENLRIMQELNAYQEFTLNPIDEKYYENVLQNKDLSEQQRIELLKRLQQTTLPGTQTHPEIDATVKHLNAELEKEEVDANWGSQMKQNLWAKFADKKQQRSTLLTTDCRTTFCRITIQSNKSLDAFASPVMFDMFSNADGFSHSTMDNKGMTITELYVSRNDYSLPMPNYE